MSCSASARPTPVNTLRPFQVVVMSGRPRMKMRVCFAAAAVGDLHAGDALQRFDDVVVGQLADVFGDDGFDDLDGFALVLEALASELSRTPVTITVSTSSLFGGSAGACCAIAESRD